MLSMWNASENMHGMHASVIRSMDSGQIEWQNAQGCFLSKSLALFMIVNLGNKTGISDQSVECDSVAAGLQGVRPSRKALLLPHPGHHLRCGVSPPRPRQQDRLLMFYQENDNSTLELAAFIHSIEMQSSCGSNLYRNLEKRKSAAMLSPDRRRRLLSSSTQGEIPLVCFGVYGLVVVDKAALQIMHNEIRLRR
jgi:hypothetical protein